MIQRCAVDGRLDVTLQECREGHGEDDDEHSRLRKHRFLLLHERLAFFAAQLHQAADMTGVASADVLVRLRVLGYPGRTQEFIVRYLRQALLLELRNIARELFFSDVTCNRFSFSSNASLRLAPQ